MTTPRWIHVLAVGLAVALVVPAGAQDRTQDQDRTQARDRDRLKDILQTDGKLSPAEAGSVEAALDGYLARDGNQERFRATVRNTIGEGCGGECLCEAVRSMNRFMVQGQDAAQAQESLGKFLREQKMQREQQRLVVSEAQRQEQVRERTGERTRERTREHTGGGAATGHGGAHGGGGGGNGGK